MSKKEKAICQTCDKEFSYYRSTLRGKDAKYCSRDCIEFNAWNKGIIADNECVGCGKTIRIFRKYCSQKCYKEHVDPCQFLPESVAGEDNPNWQGGKPRCEDCNKILSSYNSKWCRDHWKNHMSGENSPKWKGGITHLDRLERVKFRSKVQKLVFERDDYTCQMCKKRGVALQVDHIQSWAEYVELRFDINNCRTLCMDCHYFITFGKKKPEGVIWGHNLKHAEMRG